MKPSRLKEVLKTAWQNHETVIISGPWGCAKSETVDQTVYELKANYLIRHPCTEESVDGRGYPALADMAQPTETEKRQRGWCARYAEWVPFRDMHELITADSLTIVHLEDFIQAQPSVQAAYMQLLQRRQLNGFKLSEHIVFVITTNEGTDMAGGSFVLEPLKGRSTILRVEVSNEDWIEWAVRNGMPTWLISFIIATPDLLHQHKPTREMTNSANPRNWYHVGLWSNWGVNDAEVWAGRVGAGPAQQAYTFQQACLNLPHPKDALDDPKGTRIPDEPNYRYGMAVAVAFNTTKDTIAAMSTYCRRLGKIYLQVAMKLATKRDVSLYETKAYNEYASEQETTNSYL